MKTSGIYLYRDRETSANLYIGKSIHIERRHQEHRSGSKGLYATPFEKKALQRGWDALELIILESGVPKDQLGLREREWYLKMKPLWNTLFPKLLPEDLALLCHKRLLSLTLAEFQERYQKLTAAPQKIDAHSPPAAFTPQPLDSTAQDALHLHHL